MVTISFEPWSFFIGFFVGLIFYYIVSEFIPHYFALRKLGKRFGGEK